MADENDDKKKPQENEGAAGEQPAKDAGKTDAAEQSGKSADTKTRWWHDRRKLVAAIAGLVILAGIGIAIAYSQLKRDADVQNADVIAKFDAEENEPRPVVRTKNWPIFGFDRARTRYFPTNKVHPPFVRRWKYGDNPLLEFPPIFVRDKELCVKRKRKPKRLGCEGRLFFINNNGETFSLDANTGKIMWKRTIAELNASSPAYARGRLFIANLGPGQVVALDAKTGKRLWRRALPGRTESSPVVVGNKVFVGCECGELYALNAKTGGVKWSTDLGGEIKGAPAYDKGHLYIGTYGGGMYSVRATNGEVQWSAGGLSSGISGAGNFYATPAVAFGRIYIGNTDGRMYSFDQDTGELAWTYSTGGYVYSGAAVADTKHSAPTVYFGSYDGTAYALNAKDGGVRWTQDMGGRVIGSVVVLGETVYVAEFDDTNIYGFRLRDGKKKFSYHTGAYMPGITDGRRFYLVGYSSIHALDPVKKNQRGQQGQGGGQGQQGGRPGQGGGGQGQQGAGAN